MNNINLATAQRFWLLTLALAWLAAAVPLSAQTDWNWEAKLKARAQRVYELTYEVSGQKGAWAFDYQKLVGIRRLLVDGEGRLSAAAHYTGTGAPLTNAAFDYDAEGRLADFQLTGQDKQAYMLNYGAVGRFLRVGKGARAGLLDESPSPDGLARAIDSLPYWPAAAAAADTLLIDYGDKAGQSYWVLNRRGLPVEHVRLKAGRVEERVCYTYAYNEQGDWTHRLEEHTSTGKRWLSLRRFFAAEQAGEQAAMAGWWSIWGGEVYYHLEASGQLQVYRAGQGLQSSGTWREESTQLKLQLKGEAAATTYERLPFPVGLQLQGEEEQQDWLRLPAESPELRAFREDWAVQQWASFEENGRQGLRHSGGRAPLPARYEAARPATADYAIVELEDRYGLMAYDDRALTPIYYEYLAAVWPGCLIAQREGKQGLINERGDTLLPFRYEQLDYRGDSAFAARQDGRMGIVGWQGDVRVPLQFDSIQAFRHGQAVAVQGGAKGIIDRTGQWVVQPGLYASFSPLGIAGYLVQDKAGRWGYIDWSGQVVFPAGYQHLRAAAAHLMIAQNDAQFGLLSTHGVALSDLRYRMVKSCLDYSSSKSLCENIRRNQAAVQYIAEDGFGYLDAFGRTILPALPSAEVLAETYQSVVTEEGVSFTFPEPWIFEPSIQRLYKKGDYGQSRVSYQVMDAVGADLAAHLADKLEAGPLAQLQSYTLDGQPAFFYIERERVQYYDFFRKHIFALLPGSGQVLHLTFSCKEVNYLDSAQDLFELEQLVRLGK